MATQNEKRAEATTRLIFARMKFERSKDRLEEALDELCHQVSRFGDAMMTANAAAGGCLFNASDPAEEN